MTTEQQNSTPTKTALEILEDYKKLVWPLIQRHLRSPKYPDAFGVPNKYKRDVDLHWEITNTYPERQGKYLRPTLLILAGEAMEAKTSHLLNTAAAMQISEDWLLIHDDIEDDSNLRRGKPALHKIYGDALAINAGDTLHIVMWSLLRSNFRILEAEKSLQIMDEFYKILSRTTLGQGTEIGWAKSARMSFGDNDWFFIADGKTSYYTIAGPMRLGAILGGANPPQLDKLARFGRTLGRCFQLVDDLLDLSQREYRGKGQIMGNDIYESKRTLILGHLLRSSKTRDRQKISRILSKDRDQKTEEEVKWIIKKMYDYGSMDYAKRVAMRLKEESIKIFDNDLKFLAREPERSRLKTLINFILERDR